MTKKENVKKPSWIAFSICVGLMIVIWFIFMLLATSGAAKAETTEGPWANPYWTIPVYQSVFCDSYPVLIEEMGNDGEIDASDPDIAEWVEMEFRAVMEVEGIVLMGEPPERTDCSGFANTGTSND